MHGHYGIRISLRHTQKNSKETKLKEALVSIQLRGYDIVQVAEPNLALAFSQSLLLSLRSLKSSLLNIFMAET